MGFCMATQYVISDVQNLKVVQVYYSDTNKCEPAVFDVDKQVLVGLCGPQDIHSSSYGAEFMHLLVKRGLEPNATIWGVECEHLYDETYRLTSESTS